LETVTVVEAVDVDVNVNDEDNVMEENLDVELAI
jgi:hypothetical protein